MLSNKLKQALLGAAAATTLLTSAYEANAAAITVYVAANFTTALAALEARYSAVVDTTATFTNVAGATGNLTTGIINGAYSTYPQADLFFAANTSAISQLETFGTTLVSYAGFDTSTRTGFVYAEGFLELLGSAAFDVTANGLFSNGNTGYPMSPALVIARPTTAPYGWAGLQVINQDYSETFTAGAAFPAVSTSVTSGIMTASDIGLTFAAVTGGTAAWGFVALSQIATYDPSSYVLTYTYTNHYSYQPGPDTYSPILQGAIKVQGAGNVALRDAFTRWLSSRDAQSIILKGGYRIPYPNYL